MHCLHTREDDDDDYDGDDDDDYDYETTTMMMTTTTRLDNKLRLVEAAGRLERRKLGAHVQ